MSVVVTLRGSEAWQPAGQVLDRSADSPQTGTQSQSGTAIGSVRSAEANSASTETALVA